MIDDTVSQARSMERAARCYIGQRWWRAGELRLGGEAADRRRGLPPSL
jgi:hypothetical protein